MNGSANRVRTWRGRALGSAAALLVLSSGVVLGALGAAPAGANAAPHVVAHVTPPDKMVTFSTLGQATLAATTYAQRCVGVNAQFNRFQNKDGNGNVTFEMDGPSGIAIAPSGRLFVTDYAGGRVLSWPNADALSSCQSADLVIGNTNVYGAGVGLFGPEALQLDGAGNLFVTDTNNGVVDEFTTANNYASPPAAIIGTPNDNPTAPWNSATDLFYPRGLALSPDDKQLFVTDDYNNRIQIFDAPFHTGEAATDSIGAGGNGGLNDPKAVAAIGDSLFVADYAHHQILRFTGPFNTSSSVYQATAIYTGTEFPVDLAIGPDGSLYASDQANQGGDNANDPNTFTDIPHLEVYDNAASSGNPANLAATVAPDETIDLPTNDNAPLGVALDTSGRLFVADYSEFRVLFSGPAAAITPADSSATAQTATLLNTFSGRQGKAHQVIVGQELPTFDHTPGTPASPGWDSPISNLTSAGLPQPAVQESEISFLEASGNTPAEQEMQTFQQQGGIVALDWHPDPVLVTENYSTPAPTADLTAAITNGQAANTAFKAQLDAVATELQHFTTNGPVIFRPLVEVNGPFFWWSEPATIGNGPAKAERQQAFIALWRYMFTYLTVTKGIHSVLFDYAVNDAIDGAGWAAMMDDYPGSKYVDLTGVDDYNDNLYLDGSDPGLDNYNQMVFTGKPWGLSEADQGLNNAGTATNTGPGEGVNWDARHVLTALTSYPAMAYANFWYSSYSNGNTLATVFQLADLAHASDFLADSRVLVLATGTTAQTVHFTSTAPSHAVVGDLYSPTATSTSNLTVAFSTTTPAICTASGVVITTVAAGTCTVQANQAGNGQYAPAPAVAQSFTVFAPVKSNQTITFTSTPAAGLVTGGSYGVTATATSGLGVSFSSPTPGVCTVSGSSVSLVGVGTCQIDANQAGNGTYNAAPQVSQTFGVANGTPAPTGHGYWLVGSDGGIFTFGAANFFGSTGAIHLNRPVVGITPTSSKSGYWLVASDGGVFAFGDAPFVGSIPGIGLAPAGTVGGKHLNAPIVGMVPSASGTGYFMIGSDGGVFAFNANFSGSCPGIGGCSGAAVGVAPDGSGNGYWLVTATGHVYNFGDAPNLGSPGQQNSNITSIVRTPNGGGYWILDANGGVFAYGNATSFGSLPPNSSGGFDPATAIFTTSDGGGYWAVTALGKVFDFGNAPNDGDASGTHLNGSIIAATGF